jgi:hypothetical protein
MRHLPLFLTLMAVPVLPATEIQVSHELTLSQALQQLREARKSGDTSPATIRLPKGKLDITQPLMLEAQDSNLTFIGTDSTLIGGPKVTGWEKHTREIVKADVSKLLPKGFLPKQLFCDGERQILARYPNFDAKDPLYGGWAFVAPFPPAGAPDGHQWKRTLFVKPEDVRTWAHPEDVQIDIFAQYGWWNFIEPIVSLDSATRLLTLKKDCGYDLHPHNRYHFQNALEELDAPGEWFYDKHSGVLYFWPQKPIAECHVCIPISDAFFKIKSAKNITLRGLTLTGCHGTAITIEGAEDCLVENCVITKVGSFGGSGIGVNDGKNVRVSHCEISFTGNNGVSLSAPRDDTARASCGNGAKANSYHSTPTPFAEPIMKWADSSRLGRPLSKDSNVIEFGGRYLTYFSLPLFDAKLAAANATSGWSVGIADRQKRNFCLSDVYGEVVREILVSDEFISSTAGRISHSLCRHVAGRCE